MVERRLCNADVIGSSPIVGSMLDRKPTRSEWVFCYLGLGLAMCEGDAHRVDAVTVARGSLRGIFKNVTQMTTAGCASNLDARHTVASIFDQFNSIADLWLIKTWPAAVRVELVL